MRTHAASNIPCALVRSLPSVSDAALRVVSSAPSCTKKNRAATRGDAYHIKPRITYVDRAIIRGYFRQHGLVPLLRPANMEALFAEFRKYLLPDELECRLSVLPAGYRRILTGGDVLLIETVSRTIVEVLRDIYATI
ncbi:MAG: hypothetical protein Q8O70_02495 [Burkholderiales bacterium]|nr:hypothetical protein [Burkholderiales bacterium]